jgi:predicted ATPase
MPFIIITGGPGAGKTTLLREIERLGYRTVAESARAVIAERLACGLAPRPEPAAFALEILRRDIEKYEQQSQTSESRTSGWVFFDRAIPEALAMVQATGAMTPEQVQELRDRYRFHRQVFVLPPWQAIYRQDAERDQTFAHAVAVHRDLVDLYRRLGYELHEVPALTVEQRARRVLSVIAHREASR